MNDASDHSAEEAKRKRAESEAKEFRDSSWHLYMTGNDQVQQDLNKVENIK